MRESGPRDPRGSVLLGALREHALARPDTIAVRESSARRSPRALTWRALCGSVERLAGELVRGHQARVLLVSAPNCLEQMVALLAGLRADLTVVALPPDLPAFRLRETARQCAATTAIAAGAALSILAEEGIDALPVEKVLLEAPEEPPPPLRAAGTGASGSLVLLTSGTTGFPKLVRRTASALDAVGEGCVQALALGHDDAMLVALPLYHSFGIDMALLSAVRAGCRIELHEKFAVTRVLSALREDGVTTLPMVPYLFDVLARSGGTGDRPAPALRRAVSAGGLLPRSVFDEFHARFGAVVGQIYGATEFGSVTYADPEDPGFCSGTAGRALPGVEIRILDPESPRPGRALAIGAEGLVAVASASMFEGYLGDSASPLVDGFFLTGDIGRIGAGGYLELTGRLALLVDVGGRKVNPLEVEAALERHPAVQAAAVLPVPYTRTVSRLKAMVVPSGPRAPTAKELRSYLRGQIDDYKIPRSFEFTQSLPRSQTGKLMRHQLCSSPMSVTSGRRAEEHRAGSS